jgi:hypothetical protein
MGLAFTSTLIRSGWRGDCQVRSRLPTHQSASWPTPFSAQGPWDRRPRWVDPVNLPLDSAPAPDPFRARASWRPRLRSILSRRSARSSATAVRRPARRPGRFGGLPACHGGSWPDGREPRAEGGAGRQARPQSWRRVVRRWPRGCGVPAPAAPGPARGSPPSAACGCSRWQGGTPRPGKAGFGTREPGLAAATAEGGQRATGGLGVAEAVSARLGLRARAWLPPCALQAAGRVLLGGRIRAAVTKHRAAAGVRAGLEPLTFTGGARWREDPSGTGQARTAAVPITVAVPADIPGLAAAPTEV